MGNFSFTEEQIKGLFTEEQLKDLLKNFTGFKNFNDLAVFRKVFSSISEQESILNYKIERRKVILINDFIISDILFFFQIVDRLHKKPATKTSYTFTSKEYNKEDKTLTTIVDLLIHDDRIVFLLKDYFNLLNTLPMEIDDGFFLSIQANRYRVVIKEKVFNELLVSRVRRK